MRGQQAKTGDKSRRGLGIILFFACAVVLLSLVVGLASSTQTSGVTRTEVRLYGNALAHALAKAAVDEVYFRFRFLATPDGASPAAAGGGASTYLAGAPYDWYTFLSQGQAPLQYDARYTRAAWKTKMNAAVDPVEVSVVNIERNLAQAGNIGSQISTETITGLLQFDVTVRLRISKAWIKRKLRVSRPFSLYLNAMDYAAVVGGPGGAVAQSPGAATDPRVLLRRLLKVRRPVAEVVIRK